MPVYVPKDFGDDNEGGTAVQNGFIEQVGSEQIIFHRTKENAQKQDQTKEGMRCTGELIWQKP